MSKLTEREIELLRAGKTGFHSSMARPIEQWQEILAELDPHAAAARIFGDLQCFTADRKVGVSGERRQGFLDDVQNLAHALDAWAALRDVKLRRAKPPAVTVWILSTCIPGESDPCLPQVFGTEAEALKAFDEMMRGEWETNGPYDDDGVQIPYPEGDPVRAHDLIAADAPGEWGKWGLTSHTVSAEPARPPSYRGPLGAMPGADRAEDAG